MKLLFLFAALVVAVAGQDQYIIGGTNVTEEGRWPFMGALFAYDVHYMCGITLISPDWGLTSAFCLEAIASHYTSVRFGSNFKSSGGKLYSAKEFIVHEDYGVGRYYMANDVAVVKFNEPVSGENIASIPLAVSGSDHTGNDNCWILGWGYRDIYDEDLPENLQEANVTILSVDKCSNRTLGKDDTMVCAEGNGRTNCIYDEGGPMVCIVNGRYELVGEANYNYGACDPDYTPLYTRISSFRDWIYDKTGI